ncbi:MAG: SAV0927 family protein [Bacillota bacterium]|uniref:DUF3055 family protein n=1 Tax=Virgibacillus salarius TaxID=447199 RepID=A0A941DS65_9BACI|nr:MULTISPECIES: SAV0927 family protein [Bacillaceae]NAZ07249.1 DUF3055 family protein [Agaribacter marinus]MBR7794527.1 DUF3055 family protein [Virgibacillus salarius]MCC2249484.1 DUF3055 domain-containing protein [Virgibacillus sp. AGTR]MDY7043318.1 DUF3055 family protein [Virgibacillus sp. M23]QRZ17850.1 DUF3055 family protein [Virgibacillus sp. AGTR]
MGSKYELIKDETVTKEVRYISFMGKLQRYDFAFLKNDDDPSKTTIINLRKNRFTVVGKEDLNDPGKIEHIFHETAMEADEIRNFLHEVL